MSAGNALDGGLHPISAFKRAPSFSRLRTPTRAAFCVRCARSRGGDVKQDCGRAHARARVRPFTQSLRLVSWPEWFTSKRREAKVSGEMLRIGGTPRLPAAAAEWRQTREESCTSGTFGSSADRTGSFARRRGTSCSAPSSVEGQVLRTGSPARKNCSPPGLFVSLKQNASAQDQEYAQNSIGKERICWRGLAEGRSTIG